MSARLAVIQHHPSRSDLVGRLVESLEGFRVELVESDRLSPPNPWATYRRCLELACDLACDGYTHATILQDDATVCAGFAGQLGERIDAHPDAVLVLFLASQPADTAARARAARRQGHRFVPLVRLRDDTWMPAVGVTWTMEAVGDVLDWADKYPGKTRRSDDHMLGQWVLDSYTRARVLVTVPSLVQHPDDVNSLVGNGAGARGANRARSALFFAG